MPAGYLEYTPPPSKTAAEYAAYAKRTQAIPAMPARYAEYVPAPSQTVKYVDGKLVATEVLTMAEFKQKFSRSIAIKEVETSNLNITEIESTHREIGQDMFGATSLPVCQPTSRIPVHVSQSLC